MVFDGGLLDLAVRSTKPGGKDNSKNDVIYRLRQGSCHQDYSRLYVNS